jgi:hypothetical protein
VQHIFGNIDSRMEIADTVLADGTTLSAAYDRKLPVAGAVLPFHTQSHATSLRAFSLVSKRAGGETAFGTGGFAPGYFGLGGMEVAQALALGQIEALSNPYFSLVPGAAHAAFARQLGSVKIKFGMLSSILNQTFASQEGPYLPPASWTGRPKSNAALIEVSKSFDLAAMSVSLSQTRESNAHLGAQSSGALLFGPDAATSAVQLAGALMLAPRLALAGQASYGLTSGSHANNSLFSDVTAARTNAFSLALVASDSIRPGDRISVAVSQPMRTYSGQVVFDVLTGIDSSGAQIRERRLLSMVPEARELRTELNYLSPVGRNASAGVTFMLRRNPDNMIDAPLQRLLALRYTKRF